MEEKINIENYISFIIALISLVYSIYNSRKINKLNMRNNYFDIFKEDLTKNMPDFRSRFISEESDKSSDEVGKEFEKYINDFRKKIRFLSYIDNKNYKKIDKSLVKLEEEIILLPTRKKNRDEHIKNIDKLMKYIYKKINKHFS